MLPSISLNGEEAMKQICRFDEGDVDARVREELVVRDDVAVLLAR